MLAGDALAPALDPLAGQPHQQDAAVRLDARGDPEGLLERQADLAQGDRSRSAAWRRVAGVGRRGSPGRPESSAVSLHPVPAAPAASRRTPSRGSRAPGRPRTPAECRALGERPLRLLVLELLDARRDLDPHPRRVGQRRLAAAGRRRIEPRRAREADRQRRGPAAAAVEAAAAALARSPPIRQATTKRSVPSPRASSLPISPAYMSSTYSTTSAPRRLQVEVGIARLERIVGPLHASTPSGRSSSR